MTSYKQGSRNRILASHSVYKVYKHWYSLPKISVSKYISTDILYNKRTIRINTIQKGLIALNENQDVENLYKFGVPANIRLKVKRNMPKFWHKITQ